MVWEVYALRFGGIADRRVHDNFIIRDMHDGPMPLDFYVWIARCRERTVLIDTGFDARSAEQRARPIAAAPSELLRRIGIDPEAIEDIVITHLHYDHAGGIQDFPAARIHVQDREVGFATGRCMGHPHLRAPFAGEDIASLMRILHAGRVVFHDGDEPLFDGMSLHLLPGHSQGLQGVKIATRRGDVLLASDATHYYANALEQRPYILTVDLVQTLDSYERLHQLVDHPSRIVPGHDPRVGEIYPKTIINGVELIALHEQPAWPPPPF
jgi:glyoxylase-like metal-dependent hydrolase (beta-lactamase superfamily II)